ncbi:hypothetical protein UlMin_010691 [Ulmus minor]
MASTGNNSLEIRRGTLEMEYSSRSGEGSEVGDGAFLTWEDLWVTVPRGKIGSRPILQGLTGYAKPGELLAIMGPSGCGKSTLLDALAGRLSSKTRQSGQILLNGHRQRLAYGTSAYVTQDDTLMTTLTAKEAVYYSAQLQLPESMKKSEKKERAEETIREMGLQEAMNTRIGGWGVKGLSGGQKRRVSICIEILTRPKLLFLDEPTSGLDSAASYYVMSRIASLNQRDGTSRTIVASIHQPSSEVFQLFHSLYLLSSGKTVYFGPASAAYQFFASSGFPCPTLQNPSDHFLKTINKDFEQGTLQVSYLCSLLDVEQGFAGPVSTVEEAINTLIKSYKASDGYQLVRRKVAERSKQARTCNKLFFILNWGARLEKRSHANFLSQCLILTRRSFKNMHRDVGYYWMRLVIYVSLSIGLGTIFHDLGFSYESIQARGSLLMWVATFLTFMTIGGFPSFAEDMKVFERERLNGHYCATAFVISNTFSALPYLLLISLISGSLTYYLPGLHKGYQHFLYFVSLLFACMMLIESLMMIVASLVPNYLMGIITGSGIQGFMMLGGGFFRLPNDLPHYFWKYPMFYFAFHRFAYQGLFKNEFEGLVFPYSEKGEPLNKRGEDILREIWQVNMSYSKWVDLAILLGMVAFYRVLFLIIIKSTEKMKNIAQKF